MLVCVLTSLFLKYFPFLLNFENKLGGEEEGNGKKAQKKHLLASMQKDFTLFPDKKRGIDIILHGDVKMEGYKEKK